MKQGLFISFEGIEGSGKSTQARLLAEALEKEGHATVLTEEPGGTEISQAIRGLLLDARHRAMDAVAELLLYAAARRQHVKELILPSLAGGKVVITDRFSDSTFAYQGEGRGLDLALIEVIDAAATGGIKPHLTLLLDMDVEAGLRRNRKAEKSDRFELEAVAFHERVRKGYLKIQKAEPARVRLISAEGPLEDVQRAVLAAAMDFITSRKDVARD